MNRETLTRTGQVVGTAALVGLAGWGLYECGKRNTQSEAAVAPKPTIEAPRTQTLTKEESAIFAQIDAISRTLALQNKELASLRDAQKTAVVAAVPTATATAVRVEPSAIPTVAPRPTETPKPTNTPTMVETLVDVEMKKGEVLEVNQKDLDGKFVEIQGDAVLQTQDGKVFRTFDDKEKTGSITVICKVEGLTKIVSLYGLDVSKNIQPALLTTTVTNHKDLMIEKGCVNGCSEAVVIWLFDGKQLIRVSEDLKELKALIKN